MKFNAFGRSASVRTALMAGAAAMVLPAAAQAQDAEDEADDSAVAAPANSNVIIVTATKREQTLQETPVSVSVTRVSPISTRSPTWWWNCTSCCTCSRWRSRAAR